MIASLKQLVGLMRKHGADRIFAKNLAPNDNSKNQIYLGGDFSALNVIPHGDVYVDSETKAGSKRDRPKAEVTFFWVDEDGKHTAPGANLILYPDYPEVRLSGLLRGCASSPSNLVNQRLEGRVMFFGITSDREVLGYVVENGNPIGNEFKAGQWEELGVFNELSSLQGLEPRAALLAELQRIHERGWIDSQKLRADGSKSPYAARNGGGYTLEAELGISPNGYSEPDFMGWEVKQYGVRDFKKFTPKSPVTLMTPEPTGGLYRTAGMEAFVRRYGYADKAGRAGRTNFGGVYKCSADYHALTGLRMTIEGFDENGKGGIANIEGGIALRDRDGEEAASWSFKGLMQHWNRKHAQAAYIPSLIRNPPPQYRYAGHVLLCEVTDFVLFLRALVAGNVYYDPAMKVVGMPPDSETKRRSQFRIKHQNLADLYRASEIVDLANE